MLVPEMALEVLDDVLVLHVGDCMLDVDVVEDMAFLQSIDEDAFRALLKLLRISVDRAMGRLSA